ncbi:MAG: DUF547 domain-containing protein [Proteobacteria bacterium]|nr:DUF547 domain-containing protein [Pseudomonadota bacterium]
MSVLSLAAREAIVNTVLAVRPGRVLNDGENEAQPTSPLQLVQNLSAALVAMKSAAMDEAGQRVDYASLAQDPAYKEYKQTIAPQLRAFDASALSSHNERLAFWINLYNALTLDAVISFGIRASVTEGWLGVLRFFRRAAYDLNGQRLSLEDIEHGLLRANRGHPYLPGPQFHAANKRHAWVLAPFEPRIHFALNCASASCPPIAVYSADKLDEQLDLAMRNFVDQESQLDESGNRLLISTIFKWYRIDFGGHAGILDWLRRALPDDARRQFLDQISSPRQIGFLPYNWRLNL